MRKKNQIPITEERIAAAERQIDEQSKKISYYVSEYTLEYLADKMRRKEFIIPKYQRDYTWEPERKWRFIESILMNLPIPFLFFWGDVETGNLEVVDGSQRLRTIEEFIHGDLILGELERLPAAAGLRFGDLPESRRNKFKNRSIRGIILDEHADPDARAELFNRINTGSKIANPAEVRRGSLKGPFMEMIARLAEEPDFIKLTPMSEKHTRQREREEMVTRFFAYGDGLDGYADEVSPFLYAYAEAMNRKLGEVPEKIREYEERFRRMASFVDKYFPFGFRKSETGGASPRARFEAIAIGTFLALKERPGLKPDRAAIAKWIQSKEFSDITGSDGANVKSKLRGRLDYVKRKLLESSHG